MLKEILLKNIHLQGREKVKDIVRSCFWLYFGQVAAAVALILLAFFLIYPLFRMGRWGAVIFMLLSLAGLWLLVRAYYCYYFTVFVMTNRRIIDIYQKNFLDQSVSEALYSQIKDVAYYKKGITNILFSLGDIYIEFSQEGRQRVKLKLKAVKNPQAVVSEIISLQDNFLKIRSSKSEAEYLLNKIKRKVGNKAFNTLTVD